MHMINIISTFRLNRDPPVRKVLDFLIPLFRRVIKLFQSIANQVLHVNRVVRSVLYISYVTLYGLRSFKSL